MNLQQLFKAIRAEPEQHTLMIIAVQLERQGYQVTIDGKYVGLGELQKAEAEGEFEALPIGIGAAVKIHREMRTRYFEYTFLTTMQFVLPAFSLLRLSTIPDLRLTNFANLSQPAPIGCVKQRESHATAR